MRIKSAIKERILVIQALQLAFKDYVQIMRYNKAMRRHVERKYHKSINKIEMKDISPYYHPQGDTGQPNESVPAMLFEDVGQGLPIIIAAGMASELKLKKGVR